MVYKHPDSKSLTAPNNLTLICIPLYSVLFSQYCMIYICYFPKGNTERVFVSGSTRQINAVKDPVCFLRITKFSSLIRRILLFKIASNVFTPHPPIDNFALVLFPQLPSYFITKSLYGHGLMKIALISAVERQCSHVLYMRVDSTTIFLVPCLVRAVHQYDLNPLKTKRKLLYLKNQFVAQ